MPISYEQVSSITLQYDCLDCGNHVEQPVSDIPEIGTPVCPNCDVDMKMYYLAKVGNA